MTDPHITRNDVDHLADRLDGIDPPAAERALLTALFVVAVGTLGVTVQTSPAPAASADRSTDLAVEATDGAPTIREQIDRAFRPGVVASVQTVDGKIGPDPS